MVYRIRECDYELYQAPSGDWCVSVSKYGEEDLQYVLGSREEALEFILSDSILEPDTDTLTAIEQASLDYALTFLSDAEVLKAAGKTEEEIKEEVRSWIEYERLIRDPDVIEETVQMVIDDLFFFEHQEEDERAKSEIKAYR